MDKIIQSFAIMRNTFQEERSNKRVIMGFLLGTALFGYWLNLFIQYVRDTGEPVNILEAFIAIAHHNKNMLFLIVGWILIISDAPFVKGNTYLLLCRSSRKQWSMGMVYYIILQAFLYVTCIAAMSVVISSLWGFVGKMWSSPVYDLAMDRTNRLGVKYNITFPWINMMKSMTVPWAFVVTFLFMWMYFVLIGILLYVCNLLLKEIYGILLVFGIQISGYLLLQEGYARISLLAKSMPGYSIDGAGGQWRTAFLYAGMILLLILISLWIVGHVDFKDVLEEE